MGVNDSGTTLHAEPSLDGLGAQREGPKCGDCRYCKEISKSQNGMTEYVAACVYEVFKAGTAADLLFADVAYVEPAWSECRDFKGAGK